jgi:7,8-dihydropterin-6-yl-methyl-4-(beta-D-ribofuranosyl)aminobenzene 5'-phosphate synthase
MKITTLIENTLSQGGGGLKSQYGLSLLVETAKQKFLCDTGASALFARNAARLGLSLSECGFAVITHSHFDHGGGIRAFLELNPAAEIYLHPDAFEAYYLHLFGPVRKYIGLDRTLPTAYPNNFAFISGAREIRPDIHILTEVLDTSPRPAGNRKLMRMDGGILSPDTFRHELILVVREKDGLVIFSGCSHRGILNMIETVEARFLGETIKAVFGGFHFARPLTGGLSEKPELVARMGDALCCKPHLLKVYTGHCTGKAAYRILKERMGKKLDRFATGSVIEV